MYSGEGCKAEALACIDTYRPCIILSSYDNVEVIWNGMSKVIIIFSTAKSLEEARRIGNVLVEEGHIACCNIVQPVESIFKWKGKLCAEHEVLMILKTKDDKFDIVEKRIRQIHSYEVPEIIAIPLSHVSKNYLDWVVQETGIS
ncbi:MAG: divalent-cation tolerance protein CutA [Candidatus Jettenia sp.]|uniref:Divalent cation tolerance protein n=2 Tax=Candidatus Jettenia TaxID=360731 RepID=I3IPL5_9BACT|nr:MAG: divalent-cation tolerance protein CutA [Candidatus Jettenia sp. AMX1]MBC6930419.1 divalent-cation tolerance protein CutA [Candidatus Jettenia sp.]GAB63660.1 conserved hypothetical protein [Candidatus Jettenia caeni]MCE7882103.1 divalent-cation tolerance protein CutA [Candidatus Jettenia sp. AMX1]MCQ3928728.1 divalent-cation tolerance protein CutA [Candidatus Jettenia sp.]